MVGLLVDRLVVSGLAWGSLVLAMDIGCAESPWVRLDGRPGRADCFQTGGCAGRMVPWLVTDVGRWER